TQGDSIRHPQYPRRGIADAVQLRYAFRRHGDNRVGALEQRDSQKTEWTTARARNAEVADIGQLGNHGETQRLGKQRDESAEPADVMHMDQIHVSPEFDENPCQAKGKEHEPRRPEINPSNSMNPDAMDPFEVVLRRVKAARYGINSV